MFIGFAKQQDVDDWINFINIVKDNFPGLDMKEYRTTLLDNICNNQALIAKEEDIIAGTLTFSQSAKELSFLAVHPLYRKKGIAKSLILKLFSLLPKGTIISVITYRYGDKQGIAARKLYQSMGFKSGKLLTVFDYPCQKFSYTIK